MAFASIGTLWTTWSGFRALRARLLVILWVSWCMLACASVAPGIETPELRLAGIRPIPGGALEQRVEIELLAANPNDFDLVVDGMRMALTLNGQPLGRALSSETLTLPRLAESRLRLEISITLFDVLRQLLQLSQSQDLDYGLRGDFFVRSPSSVTLGFEQSGRWSPGAVR